MFPEEAGGVDFDDFMHAVETGFVTESDGPNSLFQGGARGVFEAQRPLCVQSLEKGSAWRERTLRFSGEVQKFAQGKYRAGMFPYFRETISTSDYSQLSANLLYWRLLPLYAQADSTWEKLVTIDESIPDFRQVQVTRVEGFDGPLPQVRELADYPMDAPIASDQTYKISKFGKVVALSWEATLNDYLRMFRYWPEWLARAARSTENKFVTGLMVSATGPNTALFSVDGSTNNGIVNKVTATPLTEANLIAAYIAMTTRVVANGNPMQVQPKYLVVPPALRFAAEKLLESPTLVQSNIPTGGTIGANVMISPYNAIPKLGLEVVESRWINYVDTSANVNNTWYLVAAPMAGGAMEVGFLTGHRQPQVFRKMQDAENINGGGADFAQGDFEHDSLAWKVRHVLGGIALDGRFAYAAVGA